MAAAFRSPEGVWLKQAAEYREHARECRKLALTSRTETERQQLMSIAEAWEKMARTREGGIADSAREPMKTSPLERD